MEGFNDEKATALGIRGLAPMGRRRKRKGGEKKWLGKVKLRSGPEEQEPKLAQVSPTAPSSAGQDLSAFYRSKAASWLCRNFSWVTALFRQVFSGVKSLSWRSSITPR